MLALAHSAMAAQWADHWVGGWGGGPGWLFLFVPLFWIAVIVLIAVLVTRRRRAFWNAGGPGYWHGHGYGPGVGSGNGSRAAERTLAERFARGDIDEVEYRARLEVLRTNRENGV